MGNRTPIGHFIHQTWGNLNVRCRNGKYRRPSKKNNCYNKIDILFSREEFKLWCYANKELILSLSRPSIDRIDSNNHYTIENITICELSDNIRKDKIISIDGKCRCYVCFEVKSLEFFSKDRRRQNGRATICASCDYDRKCRQRKTSTNKKQS